MRLEISMPAQERAKCIQWLTKGKVRGCGFRRKSICFPCPDSVWQPYLAAAQTFLGTDNVEFYSSVMVAARSGAKAQKWHTDLPRHLKHSNQRYAVVVFVALTDVAFAATEFIDGSADTDTFDELLMTSQPAPCHAAVSTMAGARAGDGWVEDACIVHRGGQDTRTAQLLSHHQQRVILTLTFIRKDYIDEVSELLK